MKETSSGEKMEMVIEQCATVSERYWESKIPESDSNNGYKHLSIPLPLLF